MTNIIRFSSVAVSFVALNVLQSCTEPDLASRQTTPITIIEAPGDISYHLYDFQTYKEGFIFGEAQPTIKTIYTLDTLRNAYAFFGLEGSEDAGIVRLQSTQLSLSSGTYYMFRNPIITPNGANKVWEVSGSDIVASFKDSVESPNSQVLLSSPNNAADVSRSTDLEVSWSASDSSDLVSIEIFCEADYSPSFFKTYSNTPPGCTISSDELLGFPNGRATIVIRRGRNKIGTATNGKKYILVSWSQHERDFNFTN